MFLLYDSDCGFCRWSAVQAVKRAPSLLPLAIQSDEGQRMLAQIPQAERLASAHTVGFGGVHSGSDAIIDVLGAMPRAGLIYKLARAVPTATGLLYRAVVCNRGMLGKLVPAKTKARADTYLRSASDPRSGPASRPNP